MKRPAPAPFALADPSCCPRDARQTARPSGRSRRAYPLLLAGLVAALLLAAGCQSKEPADSAEPAPRHTLIFVDRSSSTQDATRSQSLFADSLARIVQARLPRPGDRLSLFIVHQKTLSKADRIDITNTIEARAEREFDTDQALEDARFKKAQQQFLRRATDRLQAFVRTEPVPDAFARWTDLWGTLGVASDAFRGDTTARRRIYYFSDMFESMPGADRRNFDRSPPTSRAQAERWGQADASRLSDLMVLRPERLRETHIRVILGDLATKPHAQDVKFYWLSLFEALGLPRAHIRYN